jgi:hypothetical protein
MGMVSNRDKKIFKELVQDCLLYGLNEFESLEYIEKRCGTKISRSSYYSLKKRISKDNSNTLHQHLSEHTRVGFALNHLRHVQSAENLTKILFLTIIDEYSKPPEKRNLHGISHLAKGLVENIQFQRQLNIDMPYVTEMKAQLDKARSCLTRFNDPNSIMLQAQKVTNNEACDTPVVE